jgi:hypothetical protein
MEGSRLEHFAGERHIEWKNAVIYCRTSEPLPIQRLPD